MKEQIIIFGTGKIAESVSYFFNRDSNYEIAAYIVDDAYIQTDNFLNKPICAISEVTIKYAPNTYKVFVAVGYQGINSLRTYKYDFFKLNGYSFVSYRSPFVHGNYTVGENSIVMDGAIIQPCASINNNVFVWNGAMIGHHAIIEDNVWLTGGCMVGGSACIGESTFLGMGTVVGHEVTVGKQSMIGAMALVTKNVPDKTVIIQSPSEIHRLNSDQFIRMSACFRM